MNIFIGNLSFDATEKDVKSLLERFGNVVSVVIVMDKKGVNSRGFGFATLPDEREAYAVIAALDGKEFMGRPLNLSQAKKQTEVERASGERTEDVKSFRPRQAFHKASGYKKGRRSRSFMLRHVAAGTGEQAVPARKKSHENPMRWRKRPARPSSWQKSPGDTKPWEKADGQSKTWKKSEPKSKPWNKRDEGAKPWRRHEEKAKHWKKRDEGVHPRGVALSTPFKKGAKPWRRNEGESKPWKKKEGEFSPRKKAESSPKPWEKKREHAVSRKSAEGEPKYRAKSDDGARKSRFEGRKKSGGYRR